MDRDFRRGYLEIDFPTQAFASPLPLLGDSVRVFFSNLRFLAAATLVVYLPGKLATQFLCYLLDIPFEGLLSYLILGISDLLLGALAAPTVVYGLIHRFRTGRPAALGECLRWGRRQWMKTLVNQIKVEVTITLWGALLVIPGIVAMVRLTFADAIVAVGSTCQASAPWQSSTCSPAKTARNQNRSTSNLRWLTRPSIVQPDGSTARRASASLSPVSVCATCRRCDRRYSSSSSLSSPATSHLLRADLSPELFPLVASACRR